MLTQFRNFDVDRLDMDDLVGLLAFGQILRNEYEKLGMDEPDWVNDKIKTLKREIKAKNADKLAARAREVKSRIDALKTPTQRKAELEKELKKLNELMGEEAVA